MTHTQEKIEEVQCSLLFLKEYIYSLNNGAALLVVKESRLHKINCHKKSFKENYLKVTIICRYIFSGFGILCILLILNFVRASQLMIFMMLTECMLTSDNLEVYSVIPPQYLIFTSTKFCAFVQIR